MTFRVSCAQFQGHPGDSRHNLARMDQLAARAAREHQAHIVVFAEMAPVTYAPPAVLTRHAQSIKGAFVARVAESARRHGIDIAFGMPERDAEGALHNTMVYVDREGRTLAAYRKTHLFAAEREWAAPGDLPVVFPTAHAVATLWICYDTRFPELARAAALRGARLALVSTAWLGPPDEWELALRARALDNGIFVAAADQISRQEGLLCRGLSRIVDPHGRILAEAAPGAEDIVFADIDLAEIERFHARVPVLEHRRADLL